MFENMGGNIPGGNFLGGTFPGGGNFPGESLMGGNFPGENFPDTFIHWIDLNLGHYSYGNKYKKRTIVIKLEMN